MADNAFYRSWFEGLTDEQKKDMEENWSIAYRACLDEDYEMVSLILDNLIKSVYPAGGAAFAKPKRQLPEYLDKEWQQYLETGIHRTDGERYDLYTVATLCTSVYDYLVALYTPVHLDKGDPSYVKRVLHSEEKRAFDLFEELALLMKRGWFDKMQIVHLLCAIMQEDQIHYVVSNWVQRYPNCFFKEDCAGYLRDIKAKCPEIKALM